MQSGKRVIDNGKREKNNEGGEEKLTDRRGKRDIIVISLTRTDEQIGKYDSYFLKLESRCMINTTSTSCTHSDCRQG